MRIFGNIIWLIFGGIESALAYFTSGLAMMLTIIGIPLRPAVVQNRNLRAVPIRAESGARQRATRLSPHGDEHPVVLPRRLLDMLHPHPFRSVALHHHHRNPVRK